MRPRILTALALGVFTNPAFSEEPKPVSVAVPSRASVESLKDRVRGWCSLRRESFRQCAACGGDGRALYRVRPGVVQEQNCYDCRGNGWRFVAEKARNAWVSYRTPAAREHAGTEFAAWAAQVAEDPKGASVSSCVLVGEPVFAGLRHATVTVVTEGVVAGREEKPYQWVYAPEVSGKPAWFLRTDGIDPAYGSDPTEPAKPLDKVAQADIARTLTAAGVKSRLTGARLESGVLVVDLEPAGADEAAVSAAIDADAYPAVATVLSARAEGTVARVDFVVPCRDPDGHVKPRVYRGYGITRKRHAAIEWGNLDAAERKGKLRRVDGERLDEGWKWWIGKEQAK